MAAAISTKPHNVTSRISKIRQRTGLTIICTSNGAAVGAGTGVAAAAAPKGKATASGRVTKTTATGKTKQAMTKSDVKGTGNGNLQRRGGMKKPAAPSLTLQAQALEAIFAATDEDDGHGAADAAEDITAKENEDVDAGRMAGTVKIREREAGTEGIKREEIDE